mmetsp:Transcript_14515/g.42351  ORF Transcript_14515/g.42351 Transcript_14515/m.42351 type:complete len:414 (+) Transcript_14515:1715-2956(+)
MGNRAFEEGEVRSEEGSSDGKSNHRQGGRHGKESTGRKARKVEEEGRETTRQAHGRGARTASSRLEPSVTRCSRSSRRPLHAASAASSPAGRRSAQPRSRSDFSSGQPYGSAASSARTPGLSSLPLVPSRWQQPPLELPARQQPPQPLRRPQPRHGASSVRQCRLPNSVTGHAAGHDPARSSPRAVPASAPPASSNGASGSRGVGGSNTRRRRTRGARAATRASAPGAAPPHRVMSRSDSSRADAAATSRQASLSDRLSAAVSSVQKRWELAGSSRTRSAPAAGHAAPPAAYVPRPTPTSMPVPLLLLLPLLLLKPAAAGLASAACTEAPGNAPGIVVGVAAANEANGKSSCVATADASVPAATLEFVRVSAAAATAAAARRRVGDGSEDGDDRHGRQRLLLMRLPTALPPPT